MTAPQKKLSVSVRAASTTFMQLWCAVLDCISHQKQGTWETDCFDWGFREGSDVSWWSLQSNSQHMVWSWLIKLSPSAEGPLICGLEITSGALQRNNLTSLQTLNFNAAGADLPSKRKFTKSAIRFLNNVCVTINNIQHLWFHVLIWMGLVFF